MWWIGGLVQVVMGRAGQVRFPSASASTRAQPWARVLLWDGEPRFIRGLMSHELLPSCSFCGKSGGPKLRVIGGPNDLAICEECVRDAAKMLDTKPSRRRNKRAGTDGD